MKRPLLLALLVPMLFFYTAVNAQVVNTIAGNGIGIIATDINLASPQGVAVDRAGNIYVSDAAKHIIRKINTAGATTIFAGTGTSGYLSSEDGKPATAARLNTPRKLVFDSTGNLFVLDAGNQRIRCIDTNGIITTVAGGGGSVSLPNMATSLYLSINSFTLGRGGRLYIALANRPQILSVDPNGYTLSFAGNSSYSGNTGNGGKATNALLGDPTAIHCDATGNIYVFDNTYNVVRKINRNDTIAHFAGNGSAGYAGDDGMATAAVFNTVADITTDDTGNVYFADKLNNKIRKVNTAGVVTSYAGVLMAGAWAGDGSPATAARLNQPAAITHDAANRIVFCDVANLRVRQVDTNGVIYTLAGNGSATAYANNGDGMNSVASRLKTPTGITRGKNGEIVFAEFAGYRLRSIDTNGVITTLAGTGTSGSVGYIPVNASTARIGSVYSVCADAAGNYYMTDYNTNKVLKLSPDGMIHCIAGGASTDCGNGGPATAARFYAVRGIAADKNGNIYVADYNGGLVRKIDTSGYIYTFAGTGTTGYFGDGGPATNAQIARPGYLAVDTTGNIYICEDYRIRKVDISGNISTIAGNGTAGSTGDFGPAVAATINSPLGIAADTSGNIIFVDGNGTSLRMIRRDGTIVTYGGNGTMADRNPVATAKAQPFGCAFTANGDLVFTENNAGTVRRVFNAQLSLVAAVDTPCDSSTVGFNALLTPNTPIVKPRFYWERNGAAVGADTSYYVATALRSTDVIKCTVTDSATGFVYAFATRSLPTQSTNPRIYVGILPNDTVCLGMAATFIAVPSDGGTAPAYTWYKNGSVVLSGATSYSYTPAIGDSVTCSMISNAACRTHDTATAKAAMTVMDYRLPKVTIYKTGSDTTCGSPVDVLLVAYVENTQVNHRVIWYRNGLEYTSNVDEFTYRPADGDSLYCILTNNGACKTADSVYSPGKVLRFLPYKTPTVSIDVNPCITVHKGKTVTCTAVPEFGGTDPVYTWSLNGTAVATGSQYSFTPNNNDIVYCRILSNYPCTYLNSTMTQEVFLVDNTPVDQTYSVYPNPNDGSFSIYQPIEGNDGMNVIMTIYDNKGSTLGSQTLIVHNGLVTADITFGRTLAEGVYFIDFYYFTGRQKAKFVVKY